MSERVRSFDKLGGNYGGFIIDLLSDGSFQTRTCCDYDSWDRATIEALTKWLQDALPPSKVFVVHEEPDMGYYGGAEVYGVFRDRDKAEECRREHESDAVIDEIGLE